MALPRVFGPLGLLALLFSRGLAQQEVCPPRSQVRTKVLVHYMIWYAEPGRRKWIWAHKPYFDRKTMGCNNTERLATRFPPVGGSFSSLDREHAARDMALMKSNCVDGIIIDYQQPSDPVGRMIMNLALPVAVDAAVAAGLEFAIMYDTSSRKGWARADSETSTVARHWKHIISVATSKRSSYLKDAHGNLMFFLFGITPPPPKGHSCPGCAFYTQDANYHLDLVQVATNAGAFAWVVPQAGAPMPYLERFYASKCHTLFPETTTPCVGAAFPGFEAVYPDYGKIKRSTKLLRQGLELCAEHATICQVATWNDFNEGTHIQPSFWCDGNEPEDYVRVIRDFKLSRAATAAPQRDPPATTTPGAAPPAPPPGGQPKTDAPTPEISWPAAPPPRGPGQPMAAPHRAPPTPTASGASVPARPLRVWAKTAALVGALMCFVSDIASNER